MAIEGGEGGTGEGGEARIAPPVIAPPLAPPTTPGPMRVAERAPSWPIAIGITGFVLGGLGALMGVWSVIMPWYLHWVQGFMPQAAMQEDILGAAASLNWFYVTSGVAVLVMCGWLLWGSVGLVKRKRWGARVMLAWAWCAIVFVFVYALGNGWAQYHMMQGMQAEIAKASGGAGGMPAGFMSGMSVGMSIVTGLMYLVIGEVYPVLTAIWMGRASSRRHMQEWA